MKKALSLQIMPTLSFVVILFFVTSHVESQKYTFVKTRPAEINTKAYKQIAIGDIVSSSGANTEESLNLSDAIAASLFKANAQEVLDRNALEKILFKQSKLTTIDENTITQLRKKISGALLITGRIQTNRITQQQITQEQGIVVNGCRYMYYWKANCEVTVQIKIIDISTGKMLFTGPVTQKSEYESKSECTPSTARLDPVPLMQTTMDSAASKVAHLVVPFQEEVELVFGTGSVFKHPFKKVNEAIVDFKLSNNAVALDILKNYAEDASLKDKLKAQAHYNYGLGLFIDNQYEPAKDELKKAFAIDPQQMYQEWYTKIDREKALNNKLIIAGR